MVERFVINAVIKMTTSEMRGRNLTDIAEGEYKDAVSTRVMAPLQTHTKY